MDTNAHRFSGYIAGSAVCVELWPANPILAAISGMSAYLGALAPDRFERIFAGIRWLPHRTLTHWWLCWIALSGVVFFYLPNRLYCLWVSMLLGVFIHLSGDLLTPLGVPFLSPGKRLSIVRSQPTQTRVLIWLVAVTGASVGIAYLCHQGLSWRWTAV